MRSTHVCPKCEHREVLFVPSVADRDDRDQVRPLVLHVHHLDYKDVEVGTLQAYVCRGCGAPVVFKPGQVRIPHFAHRPDGACAVGARLSPAHLAAQGRIATALRARGLNVELEAPLSSDDGHRRIDVLTWPPDRPYARIAIEVQASDLTTEAIEARTASYQRLGVAPLWLRLLDFADFTAIQTLPFRGAVWIERYHARAWERWAHDHLGGRLWFMDSGTGLVWRGCFVAAHRARHLAGGGAEWTPAAQWVDLELDGPFALDDLKLGRGGAPHRFAWFVPPGEDSVRPPFASGLRVEFNAEAHGSSRDLQAHVDGAWISTTTEGARGDWRTVRGERRAMLRAMSAFRAVKTNRDQ